MAATMPRRNPPLVIFNPEGELAHSEAHAWREVRRLIADVLESEALTAQGARTLELARRIATDMAAQLARGVHKNPMWGSAGKCVPIGEHVQAVVYIHARDHQPYVHGFGNADIRLESIRAGDVRIRGMHDRTGVEMLGASDGSIVLEAANGKRLWGMHQV